MKKYKIAVLSDTHGLLRDEVLLGVQGSDLIIHAGDVGEISIINRLQEVAPVVAVKGNVDRGEVYKKLNKTEMVELSDITIYVVHNIDELDIAPEAAGVNLVIFGHSHKVFNEYKGEVLYLNPGGAGRKRFSLPITYAVLEIEDKEIKVNIYEIQ